MYRIGKNREFISLSMNEAECAKFGNDPRLRVEFKDNAFYIIPDENGNRCHGVGVVAGEKTYRWRWGLVAIRGKGLDYGLMPADDYNFDPATKILKIVTPKTANSNPIINRGSRRDKSVKQARQGLRRAFQHNPQDIQRAVRQIVAEKTGSVNQSKVEPTPVKAAATAQPAKKEVAVTAQPQRQPVPTPNPMATVSLRNEVEAVTSDDIRHAVRIINLAKQKYGDVFKTQDSKDKFSAYIHEEFN